MFNDRESVEAKLKIVGFAEGSRGDVPGIVTVHTILKSAAALGNNIILLLGGAPALGSDKYVVADGETALARKEGSGTFGVVCVKARGHWNFCPSILWHYSGLVKDADFVSLHSLYSFPVLAGYLLARLHRKPYGIWPHGVLARFQRKVSARKKRVYDLLFVNRMLKNASVLFFSAEGERAEATDLGLSVPSVIVPDGFNADEFSNLPPKGRFRARFLNGNSGPLVLFLARLAPIKGLDLLIQAMRRVVEQKPDARLAIVGPPHPASFLNKVLEWIEESGIKSKIVLTGPAAPEMRLEAYADADLYVLPSYAENFGISMFEAMACGVPALVSDTLSYGNEVAKSGGGLSLARTPEAFSAAMIELIDQPDLRMEMGARGRIFARQYSQEETGAKVVKAVECIINRHPFPPALSPQSFLEAHS
jgi:glycosyltransferase involved in cell wall biosynthesis